MPKEPTEVELHALREKFRIQMLDDNGIEVCPRCECEKDTKRLSDEAAHNHAKHVQEEKMNVLRHKSIFQDETLKKAKFENYVLTDDMHEARTNLQQVLQYAEQYKQGYRFNLIFTGNVGVGKSHLAVSILKTLWTPEHSCCFIDTDEMLRRIRASFNNPESVYTEQYFIDLATNVDFLVLDDLGAETGDIETGKQASDYTSKVLRAILNGRQDKSTIFTTNLTSKQMMCMYDVKLVDRMLKDVKIINYTETLSYRTKNVTF